MAKRRRTSVQEALEAATAGVAVQQNATVETAPSVDESRSTAEGPKRRPKRAGTVSRGSASEEKKGDPKPSDAASASRTRKKKTRGHQKTSTGYMKSTGQEIVRLTLHLTPDQKRNLKIKSLEAGFENTSAYLVKELKL